MFLSLCGWAKCTLRKLKQHWGRENKITRIVLGLLSLNSRIFRWDDVKQLKDMQYLLKMSDRFKHYVIKIEHNDSYGCGSSLALKIINVYETSINGNYFNSCECQYLPLPCTSRIRQPLAELRPSWANQSLVDWEGIKSSGAIRQITTEHRAVTADR